MPKNSDKKVILQVLPSLHSGGVERGTLDIARALVEDKFTSLVCSAGGPLVSSLEQEGSTHIHLPVHSKNPLVIWQNIHRLRTIIEKYNVDLIHVRSRAPAWSCYGASKKTGTPLISTFHGTYGHKYRIKRWYNSAMLKGLRTIAVSHFIKQHILNEYGGDQDTIHVIHRGIDTKLFQPTLDDTAIEDLKKKLSIPTDKTIILLPGRLTRWKGHLLLIEALAKLVRSDIHTLMVGDEEGKDGYRAEVLSTIKQLGLDKQVSLIGHMSDMTSIYSVADIVVSASTKPEAFGRVACEAQALEKVIVAPSHGGSLETIAQPFRDLMFEPKDVNSLHNALERALDLDTQQRKEYGFESRRYICENFSLENMCEQTLKQYNEVITQ